MQVTARDMSAPLPATFMQGPITEVIHGERRQSRRYELELEAFYYIVQSSRRQTFMGSCKIHNISSTGVLLQCSRQLPGNTYVLVSVRWPVTADGRSLRLVVTGAVVWSTPERAAIAVDRHEFIPDSVQAQSGGSWTHPIRIPFRQRRLRAEAARAAAAPKPGILLVEEPSVQSLLAPLLEGYGYAVECPDGERAIQILDAGDRPISLLITHTMQGFQRFAHRVPIILTMSDESAPNAADAALARRTIRKPLYFREIVTAVRELASNGLPAAGAQRSNFI